jgi:amino acid adenylation domain-containing protein
VIFLERSSPDGLAYIMYTSGTTGHPKGVMVPHRAILRLVLNTNYFEPVAAQRILQTGALSFDASTFEIWGALLNGGCLCHPPEHAILDAVDLKALIRKYGATAMWLTAGLFNQLVEVDPEVFERLRVLIIGGEKLSVYHVNRVKAALPHLSLINGYGPTENTTFTCFHRIVEVQNHDIPIGSPISNTQVFILDSKRSLVPIGVAGEICAGGDGLARGYLNDPVTTAEKFVPHPIEPGNRLYRTGDWGRWRGDGTVEFLGRKDQQIKLHGYRIEPGEIEARLIEHPDVREAMVLGKDLGTSTATLVAYVTGPETLDADDLRNHLSGLLPEYMIPGIILRTERMPLAANGKVDRKALPLPGDTHTVTRRRIVAPKTNTEKRVLDIWKAVVHQDKVGVTDDFFTAGGHSLAVTTLVTLIHKEFDVVLPQSLIFKPATIRDVAQYILDSTQFGVQGIDNAVVPLSGKSNGPAIFAFPPGTGDALGYIQLAGLLKPYALYAFNFLPVDTRLADYADLIIGIDPVGPYVLFGYSVGGNLAFHVARELESRGKNVSDIVMLDSWRHQRQVQFPEGEVERVAAAFLNHESVTPYLSNSVLREKAYRLIERYYHYLENAVDLHHIAANIHVLKSDVHAQPYLDSSGQEALSLLGWAEVTSGEFKTYQAKGEHRVMLNPPHLESNAALLLSIFDSLDAKPLAKSQGGRP